LRSCARSFPFAAHKALLGATQVAQKAMDDIPGADRVEALIAIGDSDAYTPEERTKAVWALG